MFTLSDARDYSFSKVPYLEREEETTDQSNFVNNVTVILAPRARLKKMADKRRENSQKQRKLSKAEIRNLTETLSRILLPHHPGQT